MPSGKTAFAVEHGETLHSLCFSRDGRHALTAGPQSVRIWNLNEKTVKTVSVDPPATVDCATLSPDGTLVASAGSHDATIKVWNAAQADGTVEDMDDAGPPMSLEEAKIAAQIDVLSIQVQNIEKRIDQWKAVAQKDPLDGKRQPGKIPLNTVSFPAVLAIQRLTVQKASLLQKVQQLQDQLRQMKLKKKQAQQQPEPPAPPDEAD
jgi:WD40 repeat protein